MTFSKEKWCFEFWHEWVKRNLSSHFLHFISKVHMEKPLDPLPIKMAHFVYRFMLLCICYRYFQIILILIIFIQWKVLQETINATEFYKVWHLSVLCFFFPCFKNKLNCLVKTQWGKCFSVSDTNYFGAIQISSKRDASVAFPTPVGCATRNLRGSVYG